jgi:AhpD family alkylhydroperoxidase
MNDLTSRERELVALGAALGSNCAPCVAYHVAEARKAGLDDAQIRAAIELADATRQVPARKALEAGLAALADVCGAAKGASDAGPCVQIGRAGSGCC